MKKKFLLALLLSTLISTVLPAQDFYQEGFSFEGLAYYTISDTTAAVGQNNFIAGDIVVPDYVNFGEKRLKVTAVGRSAFSSYSDTPAVTSITLPKGITYIGSWAFYHQKCIKEFTITKEIDFIGNNAFQDTGLETVVFEHSPEEMEYGIFSFCKMLEHVTLPDDMTALPSNTFWFCERLKDINLPESLDTIGSSCFSGCRSLEEITLPANLKRLEGGAFSDCTGLKSFTWNESLEFIDGGVFSGCTALEEMILPANMNKLPMNLMYNCTGLKRMVIPGVVTEIGSSCFEGCESLEDIVMENATITNISNYTFRNCLSLKSFNIPETVERISGNAFDGAGLETVVLGANLTTIEGNAFLNCSMLKDIYLRSTALTNLWDWNEIFSPAAYFFATLHVPEGKRNMYRHLNTWKKFQNIVEENNSGKEYYMVDINTGYNEVTVNDTTAMELHLDVEKGERLTIVLFKNNPWMTYNKKYIRSLLINGQERKTDVKADQLIIDSVEEDLDISIDFGNYSCTVSILQDEQCGIDVLKDNNISDEVVIMTEKGYTGKMKHGYWSNTNPDDPGYNYTETYEVIGKKTIYLMSQDQIINVKYQQK